MDVEVSITDTLADTGIVSLFVMIQWWVSLSNGRLTLYVRVYCILLFSLSALLDNGSTLKRGEASKPSDNSWRTGSGWRMNWRWMSIATPWLITSYIVDLLGMFLLAGFCVAFLRKFCFAYHFLLTNRGEPPRAPKIRSNLERSKRNGIHEGHRVEFSHLSLPDPLLQTCSHRHL